MIPEYYTVGNEITKKKFPNEGGRVYDIYHQAELAATDYYWRNPEVAIDWPIKISLFGETSDDPYAVLQVEVDFSPTFQAYDYCLPY